MVTKDTSHAVGSEPLSCGDKLSITVVRQGDRSASLATRLDPEVSVLLFD